jgi:hypothetical protein
VPLPAGTYSLNGDDIADGTGHLLNFFGAPIYETSLYGKLLTSARLEEQVMPFNLMMFEAGTHVFKIVTYVMTYTLTWSGHSALKWGMVGIRRNAPVQANIYVFYEE